MKAIAAGPKLLMIALLGVSGCVNPPRAAKAEEGQAGPSARPTQTASRAGAVELQPINVEVMPVELRSLTEFVSVAGTTEADADVTYSAEVAGRVEAMKVEPGDHVRRGQALARIDYAMLRAQADAARASYELADKTYERVVALAAEKLISQQEIDEARSRRVQANAKYRIADASLQKSVVRATHSGVVIHKLVETGEFVAPGTPIYRVVDYSTIVVGAQLPETVAPRVKKEAPAKVRIDALHREVDGRVRVVVPAATEVSKTFELQVEVDNPDLSILVGMAANVRVAAETHDNAVVAPHDVVIEEENQRSVFIEANGVAHKRPVLLGAAADGRVILQEGVHAGERLVVLGQRQLVDGQPVRVVQ